MKINKLVIAAFSLLLFFRSTNSNAQIAVSNSTYVTPNAAQSLVNNVLLGSGVTASNIVFTPAGGESVQLGFFNGVNSNIGLDSGIVMSTGDILDMMPGNFSGNVPLGGSDADLLGLANSVPPLIGQSFSVSSTNHAAILEFDFVPAADTVKFRYVFGSDEYTTYINTQYNDVFGFFISGPGINGPYANNAENIAIVPGTSPALPITISSVQPNLNGQYYISNTNQTTVALNGFTTVFTAVSPVICGETYHIRLAIADGSDGSLDSGVFLEALSFTSNAVSVVSNTVSGDSTIVEGCSQAAFNFYRPGSTADTLVVPVNLSGTAIEGVDYNFLPDSVTFLPGENFVSIPVIPIADGLTEGAESIIISFTQDVCGTIVLTTSLWIVPVQVIVTNPTDTSLTCPNFPITISAQFSGGYPPYTVVWSTGDTATSITVNPGTTTTTYYYTVTDTCYGQPVTDSITVTVPPNTPIQAIGTDICVPLGGTGTLTATATGGFPPYNYAWLLGGTFVGFNQSVNITGIQDTVYIVQVNDGCGSLLNTDSVFVTIGNPVNLDIITPSGNNTIVEGCGTGIFQFTRPGATSDTLNLAITISGSATMGTDFTAINDTIVFLPGVSQMQELVTALTDAISESNESIIVTYTQIGCGSGAPITDSIVIVPLAPITTNAQTTYTLVCPGDNVTINSSFTGGYPPYNIVWSNGDTTASITVSPAATTTYTYTVTDSCNSQSATQTITVNVPTASAITAAVLAPDIVCPGQTSTVLSNASGGFPGYTYNWSLNGTTVSTAASFTTTALTQDATYVLTINDACGSNPLTQNVVVHVVPYTPITLDLGPNKILPCPNTGTNITPSFSNGAPPYTFVWSAGAVPLAGDSAAVAQPSVTTTYYLTMTDACNQAPVSDSIVLNIATYDALTATASPDTTVCAGNRVTLSVIANGGAGNFTYLWEDLNTLASIPDSVSINPVIDNTVIYRVTVTDLCGNSVMDEVSIPLRKDCDVVVPNVITPNGDGENQFLVFENLELFPQPKLEVFNRWGTKVFESDNYQNNWSPADLNPGVYYFTLELGTIDPKKGFFQLLK
ncbi:MAG TPA: choice-of-anchor L domain-containing protein [Bacteroidia bacterium]|nr:choice-of-anchor L domain-containing protein [Bacteroidia bacterium]